VSCGQRGEHALSTAVLKLYFVTLVTVNRLVEGQDVTNRRTMARLDLTHFQGMIMNEQIELAEPSSTPPNKVDNLKDDDLFQKMQTGTFEVAANAILITDATGSVVWMNDEFCTHTGYSKSELIGGTPRILKSGVHDEEFYKNLWETIKAGQVWRGVMSDRRKDGRITVDETVITPVRIDNDKISHYIAIKLDSSTAQEATRVSWKSEAVMRSVVERAPYGICWATPEGELIHANQAFRKMIGIASTADLRARNMNAVYADPAVRQQLVKRMMENGFVEDLPANWRRSDGTEISVRINGHIQGDNSLTPLLECYVEDVTQQESAARDLIRVNRALTTLTECNDALTHAREESGLLQKLCDIVVTTGGYRFAWIGFANDDEQKNISPVAYAGQGADYLKCARITWADDPHGQGPLGTAIRTGHTTVSADLRNDPRFELWKDSALANGFASLISLPLHIASQCIGALNIYSAEVNAFQPSEVELLEKLAANLSYGLASINGRREKRLAAETLRRSEKRYRFLFARNPNPMLIFDWHTRQILEVNEAALTGYGYTREEFLSLKLEDLRPPEEVGKLLQHLSTTASDLLFKTKAKHRKRDGTLIDVEISRFTTNQNGSLHSLVSAIDVTESVRALEALRTSEERYRALYEHNPAAVFHSSEGRLLDCNDAMCQMLGYSRDELLTMDMRLLYKDPAQREEGRAILERDGGLSNFGADLLRKDGSTVHVLATLNVSNEPSKLSILTGVMLDVTENRKLEKQLFQAQKLEAVGQLTGGIAHDFNNLLMIINSYSELLLTKLDASHPDRKAIEQIMSAGARAASLTRQLLAFSRKQFMTPTLLKFDELVQGLSQMLQRLIGEDIQLRITPTCDLWTVTADASQLEQVILNLVVNARDAMPGGGSVEISTANVELDDRFVAANPGSRAGEYVALTVTDTGSGMDAATQARIFEPFFTTKAPGLGTGLGLSTVYGIVKQSGGYITLVSSKGLGSTFTIYLPRATHSEKRQKAVRRPRSLRPLSILVVEDEAGTREAIREYLQVHGFNVTVASDAEEALAYATKMERLDLLLTDLVMPRMNGTELAGKIKSIAPSAAVLFMSGYTDDVLVRKGLAESSTTVLAKPFQLPDLLAAVQSINGTEDLVEFAPERPHNS
jgi:two-component system, cell cycle sensor histidine kinase and response regulator CckA